MRELDAFLKGTEKRAFRMAQLATHNDADAMDIVQEAMIKLVTHYSEKTVEEWRPLFFKILENRILDWHRKQSVMKKIFFWRKDTADEANQNSISSEVEDRQFDPQSQLISEQIGKHLLACIEALPLKQQQCFLLRSWEGLSIKETSKIMGINENSVKTHYSRAMQKLKQHHEKLETPCGAKNCKTEKRQHHED